LAFAVPALATTTAACQINGTADTTSVNPATGNGVQLVGGNGTYTFSSATGPGGLNLNCAGADTSGNAGAGTLQVNSQGTFTNTVCGTGSANSTGNTLVSSQLIAGSPTVLANTATAVAGSQYDIRFVAGQGLFFWRPSTGVENVGGVGTGTVPAGYVEIGAQLDNGSGTPGSATSPNCTRHFSVTGAISGQFPPGGPSASDQCVGPAWNTPGASCTFQAATSKVLAHCTGASCSMSIAVNGGAPTQVCGPGPGCEGSKTGITPGSTITCAVSGTGPGEYGCISDRT
jgi:hypothetical protein